MRLALYSDLHTEFEDSPWMPPALDVDVIIFAGDVVTTPSLLREFAEAVEAKQRHATHIIYLCGNHEFYGARSRFGEHGYEKYRAALGHCERSTLLEIETVEVAGIRIIGATLWKPEAPSTPGVSNDYRFIRIDRPPYRRLRPADVLQRYQQTVAFLNGALTQEKPTIVATHFPPSSIGLGAASDESIADLDQLILERKPLLWLHGHVHVSHQDVLGSTRIVSNPRGYHPSEMNPQFQPRLVIET